MPVIINELIIRAQVDDAATSGGTGGNASPASKSANDDRELLVQECVAQVMEILEKKKMP